jgi:surfactin synthase thioesterase subunit
MFSNAIENAQVFAGAGLDRWFTEIAFGKGSEPKNRSRLTDRAYLQDIVAFYTDATQRGALFQHPIEPPLQRERLRDLPGGEVIDIRWPSRYRPLQDEYRTALQRCPQTRICRGRWYRHDEPRPVIISLHGWGMGWFNVEERTMSTLAFYESGYDVVLFTLPFHAARSRSFGRTPSFPSPYPVRANEGFAQSVHDLRSLMIALHNDGRSEVGLLGMSLGGFVAGLAATVEARLSFALLLIPFISLPELLIMHGTKSRAYQENVTSGNSPEEFQAAFASTTPTNRTPLIDSTKVFVAGARGDRVTTFAHARRFHEFFSGSTWHTFPGSHLLQFGRRRVFEEMRRFLDHNYVNRGA